MDSIFTPGTLWFILGVLLLVIEGIHLGVLAVFFGFGAWVTAILVWLNVIEEFWLQLAVFLVVSVVSLILLRRKLRHILTGLQNKAGDTDATLDDFAGKLATVVEEVDPQRNTGKVEYRGTQWIVRSDTVIPKGTVVRIIARDNLTLSVKPNEEAR
jgi:inner membrane protein